MKENNSKIKEDIEKLKNLRSLLRQNILDIESSASNFDEDFLTYFYEATFSLEEGRDTLDWIIDCIEYNLEKNK